MFEIILFLYSFLGLAIVCDEYMIPALETLCARWSVKEDVAGATFMAFGSAAPELVINIIQTVKSFIYVPRGAETRDNVALGVGAVIGSGMIAFMLIPASCALYSNRVMYVKRRPMLRDITFYSGALLMMILLLQDGQIVLWEAAALCGIYILYVLTVVYGHSVRRRYLWSIKGQTLPQEKNFVLLERERVQSPLKTSLLVNDENGSQSRNFELLRDWSRDHLQDIEMPRLMELKSSDPECLEETSSQILNETNPGGIDRTSVDAGFLTFTISILKLPLDTVLSFTCPQTKIGSKFESLYPLAFICSFLWIAVFSFLISAVVDGWVERTGVSDTFFGLTLVALGAEIPDTIQSMFVAKRGYGSMAVAGCIGSQVINVCLCLGLPWFLGIIASKRLRPIKLTSLGVVNIFIAASCQGSAVLFVTILLFGPVIASRFRKKLILNKLKGYILIGAYVTTVVTFAVLVLTRKVPP